MKLFELYNLKLHEYKESGLREKPHKLLAMLMLQEKDNFEPLEIDEGDFYIKYKKEIDENIKKVIKDFNFTKKDIISIIEQNHIICNDYEYQKVWTVFYEGFSVMHWGIMYRKIASPEQIYEEYFDTMELSKEYTMEELEIANNFEITNLDEIITKIIHMPYNKFYHSIAWELSPEERMFIIAHLKGKSCLNCTNGCCEVPYNEKVRIDEFGNAEGSLCIGWDNPELIGRSKVLKYTNIRRLK